MTGIVKKVFRKGHRPLLLMSSLFALSPAWGMGLGELSHSSFLGQPLDASIELMSADPEQLDLANLKVRLLSAEQARALGMELIDTYYSFDLKPQRENGRVYIDLTTPKPVTEPFINVILELRWPNGSILREYTLLLDPPVTTEVKQARGGQARFTPQRPTRSTGSTNTRSITTTATQSTAMGPDIAATDYTVRPGDSLSVIAKRLANNSAYSAAQIMDWIFQNNSRAFIKGDRNRIMAGVELQLPSAADQLATQDNNSPSSQPFTQQARPVSTPQSAGSANQAEVNSASNPPEARLSLEEEAVTEASTAGAVNTAAAIRASIDATRERNELLIRENEQLRARLELLESSDYFDNMQKLVELKDRQIEALNGQATATDSTSQSEASSAAVEPVAIEQAALAKVGTATNALPTESKDQTSWWWAYALVLLSLLGGLGYFFTRKKPAPAPETYEPISLGEEEEQELLKELDQLANQYNEGGNSVAVNQGRVVPIQSAERRPDDEVKRDIANRLKNYTPQEVAKASASVNHQHDDTDELIAEALRHTSAQDFDLAEAMLLKADLESQGQDERIADALEYVKYCRTGKLKRDAS